jgi:hypothetical protein
MEKVSHYVTAGWWEEKKIPQASPLLCIPKKDGRLRTVVDCRKRNLNTVKDLMPFPDQDMIRKDVTRAPYHSKLDMSDAYEQVRVEPDSVKNTAFSTIVGTFLSHVVQQGNCNVPATFQRLMTRIFCNYLGKFVFVYLDDIFIFSYSIKEHEEHLWIVFNILREQHLLILLVPLINHCQEEEGEDDPIQEEKLHLEEVVEEEEAAVEEDHLPKEEEEEAQVMYHLTLLN